LWSAISLPALLFGGGSIFAGFPMDVAGYRSYS
jgi:hypothetical protein